MQASSGEKPGMLLNALQNPGQPQPPHNKELGGPNVSHVQAEELWARAPIAPDKGHL